MWWMALAQAGMSLANGFGQSSLQRAEYKAQRTLDKAEYESKEKIRKASNEFGRAQGSLANWMRSVSNQRTVEAAGDAYNAMSTNLGRTMDQAVTGSLQRRIQAAEQMGAISAQAAAAGVGGSTVDLINGTMRLRNAMLNEEITKQEGQATYDQLLQRAGVMDNAYDQWDYTLNMDSSNEMGALMPIRVDPGGGSSWKSVFLETTFGAAGNLFNKSGDKSGPLSLLSKLGMNSQTQGQALSIGSSLFGGGGGASNAQIPAQGTTTTGGYTFFGIQPRQSSLRL